MANARFVNLNSLSATAIAIPEVCGLLFFFFIVHASADMMILIFFFCFSLSTWHHHIIVSIHQRRNHQLQFSKFDKSALRNRRRLHHIVCIFLFSFLPSLALFSFLLLLTGLCYFRYLNNNQLVALPLGVFDRLSALQTLFDFDWNFLFESIDSFESKRDFII